jgi:hypothetical protein
MGVAQLMFEMGGGQIAKHHQNQGGQHQKMTDPAQTEQGLKDHLKRRIGLADDDQAKTQQA